MTENELQHAVVDLAHYLGYLVHHDRPAQYQSGRWATHIVGDTGFPDLVLAHTTTRRVLFVELKSAKGRLTPAQEAWREALAMQHQYVWRPADWNDGKIERLLKIHAGQ